ncbi:MAG: DNA polymerase I, partial [Clostridia bacterium]|nr:DNA polymerase I [Clostridia bacterium]
MKLMILDGNSVINRAFYGVRLLSTKDGLFTNAIYGFLNILYHMQQAEKPDALCVAFDLHGPTFRHLRYDGYKATRHGMPDELAMQMPVMKDVLRAMNIPIYEAQGWEADDVIGTVAKRCSRDGWDCVIVTGDRDQLQLIDEHITVKLVVTRGGQTDSTNYTPEVFREEYGFEPIRLIDLKGLMGDSSDNIPGVAGVGPKTATDLLIKYGTLAGVYENLDSGEIKGKLLEKLQNGYEMALLSYELATIICEAPIEFSPADALVREPKQQELYDLFVKLEFAKLIDRYHLRSTPKQELKPAETLKKTDKLPTTEPFAVLFDEAFETAAVAYSEGVYSCTVAENKDKIQALLSGKQEKYCFDLKALYHTLADHGMEIETVTFDAQMAAYVLDPTANDYALEKLSLAYFGEELTDTSLENRAAVIYRLQKLLPEKMEQEGLTKLYREIELPLCKTLFRMEQAGIAVDKTALEAFGKMLSERIAADETLIFDYAGGAFNINSTKQLGEVLFEKLGLPPIKKTKSGYSTNADVLEKLRHQHPIVEAIMDYRMLTKLNSTYADGLMAAIDEDGRIRTTFQNTVTATGRLSSTEPNLQNIPVRTELGAEVRKMFVPRPGWVLVDADYSQIELRVLAHIADDKRMQQAFTSGEDFHKVTASQVFNVPLENVTPQMRRSAKAVNFGIVYGISAHSLSEDIGTTNKEAQAYINSYLERFTGVKQYMENIVQTARDTGGVKTMFGRARKIPEIRSSNFNVRMGAERIALNTPIQGTAADIIKLAMIRVDEALQEQSLQAQLVLQVHDELIVECPAWEAELVMG